jgi:uncharacterized RDD family membrane protein YckC
MEKFSMLPTDTSLPPVLPNVLRITPARVVRRALGLLLDTMLAGLAAMVLLTIFILPQSHPDYDTIIRHQQQAMNDQIKAALAGGEVGAVNLSDDFVEIATTAGTTVFAVLLVYFAASEMLSGGSTLGKRVFGLRVARTGTSEPPNAIELLSRSIFKAASLIGFFPLLLLANTLPIFFRPTRRALHDLLARTIVTGDPPPAATDETDDREDRD